jgi:oligoribonuclease NrnB/cAMP/cGMP phosphodiesterase (DHH superfamily)
MSVTKFGHLPVIKGDILSITHRRDFDGVSSAAQLICKYGGAVKRVLFSNYDEETFHATIETIKGMNLKDTNIIVSDLSAQDGRVEAVTALFKSLKADGNRIIWLDHHPWSDYALRRISKSVDFIIAGENSDYCASELVFRVLCSDNAVCKALSEFAHITDFNLKAHIKRDESALKKISEVITYLDTESKKSNLSMLRLAREVSAGELNGPECKKVHKEYKIDERKNLKAIKATVASISGSKYIIGVAFSTNMESNLACTKISELTGSKIQVFVTTKDGSAHVRSFSGIDCSRLSRALGGNGHPQASGFQVNPAKFSNFSSAGRKRYVEMVREAATRAYKTKFTYI